MNATHAQNGFSGVRMLLVGLIAFGIGAGVSARFRQRRQHRRSYAPTPPRLAPPTPKYTWLSSSIPRAKAVGPSIQWSNS